jgi:hypothetical protein
MKPLQLLTAIEVATLLSRHLELPAEKFERIVIKEGFNGATLNAVTEIEDLDVLELMKLKQKALFTALTKDWKKNGVPVYLLAANSSTNAGAKFPAAPSDATFAQQEQQQQRPLSQNLSDTSRRGSSEDQQPPVLDAAALYRMQYENRYNAPAASPFAAPPPPSYVEPDESMRARLAEQQAAAAEAYRRQCEQQEAMRKVAEEHAAYEAVRRKSLELERTLEASFEKYSNAKRTSLLKKQPSVQGSGLTGGIRRLFSKGDSPPSSNDTSDPKSSYFSS